jgi:hypothetical protein
MHLSPAITFSRITNLVLGRHILRGCNILLVRIIYSLYVIFLMVCHRVPWYLQLFITSSLRMPPRSMGVSLLHSPMTLPYLCPMAVCDELQEQLDSLTDYFKRWRIKVNKSKPRLSTLPDAGLHCGYQALGWFLTVRRFHGLLSLNTWG